MTSDSFFAGRHLIAFCTCQRAVIALLLFTALSTGQAAHADTSEDFLEDLRVQPYVFVAPGSFTSYSGGGFLEFGAGADWLVRGGLGLGFSVSILGGGGGAIGVGAFDVSYHFIPSSSRIVPFVFAGVSAGSAAEYGTEGYAFLNAGAGVNLWSNGGVALRVEGRGRFEPGHGDHNVSVRFGVTF